MTLLFALAHAGPAHAALKTEVLVPATVLAPGEHAVIEVRLTNRTRDVLYFPEFFDDACWVDKYVELNLDPPREPPTVPACKPQNKRIVPEETYARKIDLTKVFSLPAEDVNAVNVAYKNGGADVYSPTSTRVGPIKVREPFHTGRMLPGDSLFLPDKSSLEFVRFVPQQALAKGEEPKLELEMIHRIPGKGETTQTFAIPYNRTLEFRHANHVFRVPQHQYGQWIDLKVFPGR